MTCIVGLIGPSNAYIMGDHMGSDGYTREMQKRSKVFSKGDFIIGYTTSFRMGQILEHVWEPPKRSRSCKDATAYMVKYVVPSIIKTFEKQKFLQVITTTEGTNQVTGQAAGGIFLIGYKNHLYTVQNDFSVLENTYGYAAVGCGADVALGALAILSKKLEDGESPFSILLSTLDAVVKHSALVDVDWNNVELLHT